MWAHITLWRSNSAAPWQEMQQKVEVTWQQKASVKLQELNRCVHHARHPAEGFAHVSRTIAFLSSWYTTDDIMHLADACHDWHILHYILCMLC